MMIKSVRTFASLLTLLATIWLTLASASAQTAPSPATLQSETPSKFEPTNHGFDHVRRDVMIPMRDGVKLHTVILVPKGAKGAPILLTRTPYDADRAHEPRRERAPRARSSPATTTPRT